MDQTQRKPHKRLPLLKVLYPLYAQTGRRLHRQYRVDAEFFQHARIIGVCRREGRESSH